METNSINIKQATRFSTGGNINNRA